MSPLDNDLSFNFKGIDFTQDSDRGEVLVDKTQDERIEEIEIEVFVGKKEQERKSGKKELWDLDIAYEKGWVEIDKETKKISVNEWEFDIVILGKKKDKQAGGKRHAVGVRDESAEDYKDKVLHFHRKGKKIKVLDSKDFTIKKLNEEEMEKVLHIASIAIAIIIQQNLNRASETEKEKKERIEKLKRRKISLHPKEGYKINKHAEKIPKNIILSEKRNIREEDDRSDKKSIDKEHRIKESEDKKEAIYVEKKTKLFKKQELNFDNRKNENLEEDAKNDLRIKENQ